MKIDFSNKDLYNYKYIPLLRNTKRYIFLMGGGGSGKSKFQAQKEIIKTFQKNRLICIRKVYGTLKDSCYSELIGVINDWSLQNFFDTTKSPLYIKNKITGSDILFKGLDDAEKIKSIKEPTRIWIEEATEINKEDFNQLDIRLRGNKKELQITCSYNPISDQHWLITDFWNYGSTNEVECIHSTYKDNRFVGQEQFEKVMNRLKEQDINMYNIYALGKPGKLIEGIIFNYTIINKIPEQARLKGYGLDFGYNDPTALIGIYEYNDNIILDEIIYKSYMNNQELINLMKALGVGNERIVGDHARPEAIDEIHKAGFDIIPCTKGKDSIINGIQLMKQYKIFITSNSNNLIKEFNNYTWSKDKNGNILDKPIDAFNHGIDASRYGINEFFAKEQEFNIYIG